MDTDSTLQEQLITILTELMPQLEDTYRDGKQITTAFLIAHRRKHRFWSSIAKKKKKKIMTRLQVLCLTDDFGRR